MLGKNFFRTSYWKNVGKNYDLYSIIWVGGDVTKSKLEQVVDYLCNHRQLAKHISEDGRLELTNNQVNVATKN